MCFNNWNKQWWTGTWIEQTGQKTEQCCVLYPHNGRNDKCWEKVTVSLNLFCLRLFYTPGPHTHTNTHRQATIANAGTKGWIVFMLTESKAGFQSKSAVNLKCPFVTPAWFEWSSMAEICPPLPKMISNKTIWTLTRDSSLVKFKVIPQKNP